MKNYFIFHLLLCTATAILSLAGCKPDEPVLVPELEITNDGDIGIAAEGGTALLTYKITNPAENGKITSATEEECDWISSMDYESTPGVVMIEVAPNTDKESRSVKIILTYTYTDKTIEDGITLVQKGTEKDEPGPDIPEGPDYEFEAFVFTGDYYGTRRSNNELHTYTNILSSAEDITAPGATSYQFELYCEAPADGRNPLPDLGTYTCGNGSEAMTFVSAKYTYINGNGAVERDLTINDGTIEFGQDGKEYFFDATLTDSEGKVHHITYSSSVSIIYGEYSQDPHSVILTKDVDFMAKSVEATYKGTENNVMHVSLLFDDHGETRYQNIMHVEAYIPYNEEGKILPGTYNISSDHSEYTIETGEIAIVYGIEMPYGTYLEYIYYDMEGSGLNRIAWGAITKGTMNVAGGDNGTYDITMDFTTAEGHSITGTYEGEINLEGFAFTTLTGDREVILDGAIAKAECMKEGNYESIWELLIASPDGGDCIRFELATATGALPDGIPSGTYYAATDIDDPWEGEYIPGYLTEDGKLGGSLFYSDLDADGRPREYAPAIDGDFIVENHGDGTYDISFEMEDDMGNVWSGQWSGEVEVVLDGLSTLKEDRNVVFDNATATATRYGETWGGYLWEIEIKSQNGGDAVRFNVASAGGDFSEGVPTYEYYATVDNDDPWEGEYITGYRNENGELSGSFFFSDFDSDGNPQEYAPAIEGDFILDNNGDGTYSISFAIEDDLGYVWSGQWNGAFELIDNL